MTSDTPRTDSASKDMYGHYNGLVTAEFARTLERELNAAKAIIANCPDCPRVPSLRLE